MVFKMINSVQSNNMAYQYDVAPCAKLNFPKIEFGSDIVKIDAPMSEHMTKKRLKLTHPACLYNGALNGSIATLKTQSNSFLGLDSRSVKGNIDGEDIELIYKNNSFKGIYGDNEFDLKLEKTNTFGKTRYISGTINDEEVKFDLQNSEIPKDKEIQDILSSVLLLNGEAAKTKDGKFSRVINADWKAKEELMLALMLWF